MKFIPTYNELAFSCLLAFKFADLINGEDLNSMILKASQNIDACFKPRIILSQDIHMEFSMNQLGTVFIQFSRLMNGSKYQDLAEIIYDKHKHISVRGEEKASEEVIKLFRSLLK